MATQLQRLAHLHFKLKCYGEPILLRRAAGGRVQRPLWAMPPIAANFW